MHDESPAALETTPEDIAFVEAENARMEARLKGDEIVEDPNSEEAIERTPFEEEKPEVKADEVVEESAEPSEGEPKVEAVDPTLAILQELRAERQAREQREAEWLAKQEEARLASLPKTLAERPIDWHRQYAAQLGYDFSDPKTAQLQAKLYEQQILAMDERAEREQLKNELAQLRQQASHLVRQDAVSNALNNELANYNLSDAARTRVVSVTNKLINAGYDARDALNESLALVGTLAQRKSAPTTQQPSQPSKQPAKPSPAALRAGAIQGRGASRTKPQTAGQKLEATRNRIFSR